MQTMQNGFRLLLQTFAAALVMLVRLRFERRAPLRLPR
jgi:hypothetical protein